MKPPTTEPAMPSRIVMMAPPGSRPGMMAFAMIPAIRPKTIQPIIANISFSSYRSGCVLRARGPKAEGACTVSGCVRATPGGGSKHRAAAGGAAEGEDFRAVGLSWRAAAPAATAKQYTPGGGVSNPTMLSRRLLACPPAAPNDINQRVEPPVGVPLRLGEFPERLLRLRV